MPFKSVKQQRYLESEASPLTEAQKREFESATNFKTLPEKKDPQPVGRYRSGSKPK